MSATVADINPKSLDNAKRQFVELYGSALVMNTYLKIALLLVCLLAVGLLALNFRTQAKYATVKPLVIRIDDVGRAEAVSYDAATYRPQTPELRYFLTRFVATHFSRLRGTVQRDYPDSLFFLDPTLADATIAQNEQTRIMETYLTNASVDFEKRYVTPGTRQERKRETFVAQIDFVLRDAVPNTFIRVNPLGLQITYFRVDQAFSNGGT